jgi:hypothetical protein
MFKQYMPLFSSKDSVTFEIVKNNKDLHWDFKLLSNNINITIDVIKNNLEYIDKWDPFNLSKNKNFTIDIILSNINLIKWDINGMSLNNNITWDIVQKYNLNWNYKLLSLNENITFDIVKNNLDNPWCFDYLIRNKNITWKIIIDNPEHNWNHELFLYNPNLELDILEKILKNIKNSHKYLLYENIVLQHQFLDDKNNFILNCYKKYFSSNVLSKVKYYRYLNIDKINVIRNLINRNNITTVQATY